MSYPFVASPNINHTSGRQVDVVVIHTMEMDEKGDTAESCAHYFSQSSAQVSAHYCVDNNSVVQCVKEDDVAWHAPGANHNGIGVEHAGRAKQTGRDWSDPYSTAMLALSAQLVGGVCSRHKIPVVWLQPSDLVAGKRGITSHANVSKAFKRGSHWDPGDAFPIEKYLAAVRGALGGSAAAAAVQPVQADPPTLKRGSKGWQVKRLQRQLRAAGVFPPPAPIDGSFGDLTYTAVFGFQGANGLGKDGIVGPVTWRALAEAVLAVPDVAPTMTDAHDRATVPA
jgi:N-acetyl-anhydromuramyl-L-alanine amidase AmpD